MQLNSLKRWTRDNSTSSYIISYFENSTYVMRTGIRFNETKAHVGKKKYIIWINKLKTSFSNWRRKYGSLETFTPIIKIQLLFVMFIVDVCHLYRLQFSNWYQKTNVCREPLKKLAVSELYPAPLAWKRSKEKNIQIWDTFWHWVALKRFFIGSRRDVFVAASDPTRLVHFYHPSLKGRKMLIFRRMIS